MIIHRDQSKALIEVLMEAPCHPGCTSIFNFASRGLDALGGAKYHAKDRGRHGNLSLKQLGYFPPPPPTPPNRTTKRSWRMNQQSDIQHFTGPNHARLERAGSVALSLQ